MPRAKATKKQPASTLEAEVVAEDVQQNAAKKPAANARVKRAQTKSVENEVAVADEAPPVVAKPKGRAKKAPASASVAIEAEPALSKTSKPREKKESTPPVVEAAAAVTKSRVKKEKAALEEPIAVPKKGRVKKEKMLDAQEEPMAAKSRVKIEKTPTIEEPVAKVRSRKRKEPAVEQIEVNGGAEASELLEVPSLPVKQRRKREQTPNELPEAAPKVAASKSKKADQIVAEASAATKSRARGATKRLADVDIAKVLQEEPEPAIRKRGKKSNEQSNDDAVVAEASKKRAKKVNDESSAPPAASKRPAAKKAAKENDELVAPPESKPARGRKRGAVEPQADAIVDDDEADGSKPSKAKKAAPAKSSDAYNKANFESPAGKEFNLKISSWNVAGLRAWLKKDGLKFLEYEEPDIFCMQETKCSNDQLPEEVVRLSGYHPYWLCMPGGYAGVAVYSKIMPIHVDYGIGSAEFDDVGRMITAEYEKFYLVNVYVPNSGRKLVNLESRMVWEKLFQAYIQKLDALKPVVICGDMNVSHMEIDLANPKSNTRNAGFTKEERDKMTDFLALGYVDTFRHLYPERKGAYTFWTYMANSRARNVGWRLDYCIVSERFIPRIVDNCMRSQCLGSDHCPITVFLSV